MVKELKYNLGGLDYIPGSPCVSSGMSFDLRASISISNIKIIALSLFGLFKLQTLLGNILLTMDLSHM